MPGRRGDVFFQLEETGDFMKQLTGERILGAATVLVGAGAMRHAVTLGFRLNDEDMGVGLFPLIVGGCLVLCGLYQLAAAGRAAQHYRPLDSGQIGQIVRVFAGLVAYAAAMEYLGYMAATFLFVIFLTRLLGAGSWARTVAMAAVTAVVFALVFQTWMQMPLPAGLLDLQGVL
jgi:putative tricarboxylic transport membrane protein